MGSTDLAGRKRLGGNGGSLFRRRVSRAPGSASGNNRNALLEDVAHHQGGQRRQAGAGSTGSRYNLGAAGGDANFCWAQRLRRFEEDESAAAVAGELRLDGNHFGPAVPRVEVAAHLHSEL